MAHFAKLDSNNVVTQVLVVDNEAFSTEAEGAQFLTDLYGDVGPWVQTSYNTKAGKHYDSVGVEDSGNPFRKNFAGIGLKYDLNRDAFLDAQPYPSWTLNETTCVWECPVTPPVTDMDNSYIWEEGSQSWVISN
jgi:hypothetical protein